MIYGYARVSTDAQDLSNRLAELKAAGCDPIFREKITGAHAERPQLKRLLRKVTHGDVVIVPAVETLRSIGCSYNVSAQTIRRLLA
jgi:DNA invertase Pin-like site-specific DNA recombinase